MAASSNIESGAGERSDANEGGSAAINGIGPTQSVLTARRFSSWYGRFQALHDVDLSVPTRGVTAVVGPSGCGKSTLLRWVNRMNDAASEARAMGSLLVAGLDVLAPATDVLELRRRVGLIFSKPSPFPQSVYDNVAFGVRLHFKPTRSQLDDIVERSLRLALLWDETKDRLDQPAHGLPAGQQQRLCIARAMALSPALLMMDEPCAMLDPKSTVLFEDLIADLRTHCAILLVTNNVQQAGRVADTTSFLFQGRVIETGETHRMFTNPRKRRTEAYLSGRFG